MIVNLNSIDIFIRRIIILYIVLTTGSLFFIMANIGPYIEGVIAIALMMYLIFSAQKIKIKELKLLICVTFLFVVAILLNLSLSSYFNSALKYHLSIIFRFILVSFVIFKYRNNSENILPDIYFVLNIILIHSLVNFVIVNFFYNSFSQISIESYSSTYNFLGLFFHQNVFKNIGGINFLPNQGIFWEPGVLQFFLNSLLFILLAYKRNILLTILTVIAILTTYSTLGYLIMILIIGYQILTNKSLFILVRLFFLLLIFVLLIPVVQKNIKQKFFRENTSLKLRMYDYTQALKLIETKPISGFGLVYDSYKEIENKYPSSMQDKISEFYLKRRGNTNSFLMLFVYFGIPLSLIFLFFYYHQDIFYKKRFLFVIYSLLVSLVEPLLLTNFYLLFLSSGMFAFFNKVKLRIK